MRDWNPSDTYIASCLRPFNTHAEGREHEQECPQCQRIIHNEPEENEDSNDDDERQSGTF